MYKDTNDIPDGIRLLLAIAFVGVLCLITYFYNTYPDLCNISIIAIVVYFAVTGLTKEIKVKP